MFRRRIAAALLLVVLPLAAACEDATPKYSLHGVMLQMDWETKQVERNLGSPSTALSSLESLKRWGTDPAFERHLARSSFQGDPAEFRNLHKLFLQRLDASLMAARANDPARVASTYAPLRMSCELCHAKFQPKPR